MAIPSQDFMDLPKGSRSRRRITPVEDPGGCPGVRFPLPWDHGVANPGTPAVLAAPTKVGPSATCPPALASQRPRDGPGGLRWPARERARAFTGATGGAVRDR